MRLKSLMEINSLTCQSAYGVRNLLGKMAEKKNTDSLYPRTERVSNVNWHPGSTLLQGRTEQPAQTGNPPNHRTTLWASMVFTEAPKVSGFVSEFVSNLVPVEERRFHSRR